MTMEPLLKVLDVTKDFRKSSLGRRSSTQNIIRAVDGVSLEILPGETLGLVGESGSGKTTLARCIMRTCNVTSGRIVFDGIDTTDLGRRQLLDARRNIQMVFQDSQGALNPRRRVTQIIGEPMAIHGVAKGSELRRRVADLMEMVGLNPNDADRFPGDFSGGQRQRIGLARALGLRPKLVVLDEPVSALDSSIQAQILNLIVDLKKQFEMAYLLIAHDLSVVNHLSDQVAVMYGGRIVECARAEELNRLPRHYFTHALHSAEPGSPTHTSRLASRDSTISPENGALGCSFSQRCPAAEDLCRETVPTLVPVPNEEGHRVACHFPRTT